MIEIGDKYRVLVTHEHEKFYIKCTVVAIYKKKFYNMYLCESVKGLKTTFNDYDVYESNVKKAIRFFPKVKKGW